VIKTIFESNL